MNKLPKGAGTGRKSIDGDRGDLSSFNESGPTNPGAKRQGPNFSHAVKNAGPNGCGDIGTKGSGSFKP